MAAACGVAGKHVLDAGCGAGPNAEWLARQGARVTAIDISEPLLKIARERLAPLDERVEVHRADIGEPLTFLADGSVDLILSSLTLHYLDDWSSALEEMRRILVPDGHLVFSTHHPISTYKMFNPTDYFDTGLVRDRWTLNGTEPHEVSYFTKTLSATVNAVRAAGFVLEELVEPEPDDGMDDAVLAELRALPPFLLMHATPA